MHPIHAQTEAFNGHLEKLKVLAVLNSTRLHNGDSNGWRALHEAVRAGHLDVVNFLLENGADVNARTTGGDNGNEYSALQLAVDHHGESHPITDLLRNSGALP